MATSKQKQIQTQQQKLTPQQITAIKLLEIPTIELDNRIKEELEKNPLLEEGEPVDEFEFDNPAETEEDTEEDETQEKDEFEQALDDFDPEEYMNDIDEYPEYKLNLPKDKNVEEKQIPMAVQPSFRDSLENQLTLNFNLTDNQKIIADYILGNLDDDGYLRRDITSIADDIAFKQGVDVSDEEVKETLKIIQQLDPPGIAAQSLQESMIIQLERKLEDEEDSETLQLALKIVKEYFEELGKKHYEKIMSKLGISREVLEAVLDEIKKLNPKPGMALNEAVSKNFNTITPDFILDIDDNNEITVTLNDKNSPKLRINKQYEQLLKRLESKNNKDKKDKETTKFIKKNKEDAEWFITALSQRQKTMLHTMKEIAKHQKDFFLTQDDKNIKPMILKDIADKTGYDVSTISRVVSNKYVQTPFGIYPLKYFFSDKLQTSSGEDVSTRKIKEIIKEIIDKEDKHKPYSDDKIAQILKNKGFKIARRTVAKYREQMNIPDSRLRKEI